MANEIHALLQLIDDPDEEVYDMVAHKILKYGHTIIPQLEALWEQTADEAVQKRIEHLIHRVNFEDVQLSLLKWSKQARPSIFEGAIIIAQYQYPQLNQVLLRQQFERIRKDVWLELNDNMSPLETVEVFTSILFSYHKFIGHELTVREPNYFFINNLLDSKQGNCYTLGLLILSLCEVLDVPLFAIDIPRQFLLAYISILPNMAFPFLMPQQKVSFYVDPLSFTRFTQQEVDAYLKKLQAAPNELYFEPVTNQKILYKMLEDLSLCYTYKKDDLRAEEINELKQILMPPKD